MSIIFWIIIASMTVMAVAFLAIPLLRARAQDSTRADHALEVYRRQLDEIKQDVRRGVISEPDAAAAETEIKRRMLHVAGSLTTPEDASEDVRARARGDASSRPAARMLAACLSVVVPIAAGSLYLWIGSPFLEPNRAAAQVRGAGEEHMDMTSLVTQLTARLAEAPDDLSGWMLLGRSYSTIGEFGQAVDAYEKAVALLDGRSAPMVLAEYAEALVFRDEGTVSAQAQAQFRAVLEIVPTEPRSRFYLAVARAQTGDLAGALQDWVTLAASAKPDAPWLPAVRRQIDQAAEILKVDVATLLPDPNAPLSQENPQPAPQMQSAPGPDAAQMAAAADMSADDRAAMIGSMVERLATRLNEETPDDVDGWVRLARAYSVQGKKADELGALERAAKVAPNRLDVQAAYAESLQEAGEADPVTDRFAGAMRTILTIEPGHKRALWFLGAHALQKQELDEARAYWQKLLDAMEPGSVEYQALSRNIAGLGAP